MTPQPPPSGAGDERADFEAWWSDFALGAGHTLEHKRYAWLGWQNGQARLRSRPASCKCQHECGDDFTSETGKCRAARPASPAAAGEQTVALLREARQSLRALRSIIGRCDGAECESDISTGCWHHASKVIARIDASINASRPADGGEGKL